jgi:hypothetical protein
VSESFPGDWIGNVHVTEFFDSPAGVAVNVCDFPEAFVISISPHGSEKSASFSASWI